MRGVGGNVNLGKKKVNHRALLMQLLMHVLQKINKCFMYFTICMQKALLPQWTAYDRRVFLVFLLQLTSCDFMALTLMKTLQFYFKNENFLLLLSVGSLGPFARCVWYLWKYIPCPSMASSISNVALVFTFVLLLVLGLGTYSSSIWAIYVFIFSTWPWMIISSMISRLFIDRNLNKNPFSPILELPILGLTGSFAQVFMVLAVKTLSIADCVVLTFFDPILEAVIGSTLLGRTRLKLHARQVKIYLIIGLCVLIYTWGAKGADQLTVGAPSLEHIYFITGRALLVLRSIFVKRSYAKFNMAKIADVPPEDGMLFYNTKEPRMHRFQFFPVTILHTLDTIWDSGLRDTDLHGMGPMGTQDIFMLTEQSYILPISTMMAWAQEFGNMKYGVFPPAMYSSSGLTAQSALTSAGKAMAVTVVEEVVDANGQIMCILIVVLFMIARFLNPFGVSKSFFDRASSSHSWKYRPLMLTMPFFAADALYLNPSISKFQIIVAALTAALIGYYRSILWNLFKRKKALTFTQKVQYRHPQALRTLQKRTMLECVHNMSIDDYNVILLETTICNGNNIREITRDVRITVWDPSPTATAAWKLAFSLVTKSLKKQKQTRQLQKHRKATDLLFITEMLFELADRAVNLSEGHGGRVVPGMQYASIVAKRCAFRKLHRAARGKRDQRQRRKMGQLAAVQMTSTDTDGAVRSIQDVTMFDTSGGLPPGPQLTSTKPALPAPPTVAAGVVAQTQMSLTTSTGIDGGSPAGGPSLPSAIAQPDSGDEGPSDEDDDDRERRHKLAVNTGGPRGVWYAKSVDVNDQGGSPICSLVLSCGNMKLGQLGVSKLDISKKGPAAVHIVEELRGTQPVQVEATGGGSFVVSGDGKVYAFGSNRALELGLRKDVIQITTPLLLKSVRKSKIVQVAGSPSASGQAHTIALTAEGEVYTFGTSSRGALGHGPEVRQTQPRLMHFTEDVRIRYIAAGARHSLMVSDTGKLWSFGDNSCGQLGTDYLDDKKRPLKCSDEPVPVGGPLFEVPIIRLAVGDDHNLAVTEDNLVFSWGAGSNGQLGIGRLDDQHRPVRIRDLEHQGVREVSSVACGARHSLVVSSTGQQPGSSRLFAFGSNVAGQLGIGQSNAADGHIRTVPQICRTLSDVRDMRIVMVVAASCHSLALTQVGEVYSFGDNAWGQLGFQPIGGGTNPPEFAANGQIKGRKAAEIDAPLTFATGIARLWTPTRIVGLSLYQVKDIATADTHSIALAS